MGLIITIVTGGAAVIIGAAAKILADDAKEFAPLIADRLLKLAVHRLPEAKRERYAEEWAGRLHDAPGVVAKFALTCGFQLAATKVALDAREEAAWDRYRVWHSQVVAYNKVSARLMRDTEDNKNADASLNHSENETRIAQLQARLELIEVNLSRGRALLSNRPPLGFTICGVKVRLAFARARMLHFFKRSQAARRSN